MSKLRAGVIGLGMGKNHIKNFQEHPEVEVAAICDLDQQRLAKIQEEYGITTGYTDPQEMLDKENLDIVSIATPNKFHMPLTVAALEAGAHVLCEKPMAMNAGEAQTMLDAAAKAGKRIGINFSYRFGSQSQALKREVERGTFGEFYFGRTVWHRRLGMPGFGGWFGNKELAGGGPLIDLGVHRLDLALWLMDYPKPVWVMGNTYNPIASRIAAEQGKVFTVEDLASGMIRFENGASLVVEASWAGHVQEKELMSTRLFGTKGGLIQRNVNGNYEFEAEYYLEKDGDLYDMKLNRTQDSKLSAMSCFADAILKDEPHIATGEEGLTVMKLLDALYLSAQKGEPVKIA